MTKTKNKHQKEKAKLKQIDNHLQEFKALSDDYINGLMVIVKSCQKLGIPQEKMSNRFLLEAIYSNFAKELGGLYFIFNDCSEPPDTFNYRRYKLFIAICGLMADKLSTDEIKIINQNVKDAATEIYNHDGMTGIKDPLIWYFIHDHWKGTIDSLFNGIGDWVS